MKKVEEIRCRRQALHINNRHSKAKEVMRRSDAYEVAKNMGLIRSPAAGLKQLALKLEEEGKDDLSLISTKLKQKESRVVEELDSSYKEMDVE